MRCGSFTESRGSFGSTRRDPGEGRQSPRPPLGASMSGAPSRRCRQTLQAGSQGVEYSMVPPHQAAVGAPRAAQNILHRPRASRVSRGGVVFRGIADCRSGGAHARSSRCGLAVPMSIAAVTSAESTITI